MTQLTPEQFLMGGGGKSAKFDTPGTTITGTITSPPQVRQQTDMETGKPLTWDNGDPRLQLVVQLQTNEHDDNDDDGTRNLYVKGSRDPASGSLHAAVAIAVQAAGAKGLEPGGTLSVKYVGDGVAKTRGFNPPKRYVAKYTPPAADWFNTDTTATGDQAGEETGAQGSPAPPDPWASTPAPAAAAASSGPTPEQVAAVRAAGLNPTQVFPGYQDDQPPF